MLSIDVYNQKGEKVKKLNLKPEVFGLALNLSLLKQAYLAVYSNIRKVIAHTKNRAERAGSGIKPWKQKGTGRARVGSVRTPVWRKGGVVFGPTKNRNFSKKINLKMKRKALLVALSGKAADKELVVMDKLAAQKDKTKEAALALKNLKISGSILIGFLGGEKSFQKISRNIKGVSNIETEKLNVFDVLNNKHLLLSEESVKYLEKKYSPKK